MAQKFCKSCRYGPLLEQFTCQGCPPQSSPDSFDLCFTCSSDLAREAHATNRGKEHAFELYRLARFCDYCEVNIESDFLMCMACRQDNLCFDLCYTCAFSADAIPYHQSKTSVSHQFRPVIWTHYIPPRQVSTFNTTEPFWCNICSQELNREFFHCLGCGTGELGFDLCGNCADNGAMFRHGGVPHHTFVFVRPVRQSAPSPNPNTQVNPPPPPYRPPV